MDRCCIIRVLSIVHVMLLQPSFSRWVPHKPACPYDREGIPAYMIVNNGTNKSEHWEITRYCEQNEIFGGEPPLMMEIGYVIIICTGLFFTMITIFMRYFDRKILGVRNTSEYFNTAGRSVKTGLTAAVIVSKWTWPTTILESSTIAYKYGIAGPLLYATGATVQIFLFGVVAIALKRKAPKAHTICEIIRARWGPCAHKVFLFFTLMTNLLVTSLGILSTASILNAMTGMEFVSTCFFIPICLMGLTMIGGLKANFMVSYLQIGFTFVAILMFLSLMTLTDSDLGSSGKVYKNLLKISAIFPVQGNQGGSYLTFFSKEGIMFGIMNLIGNFSTMFCDQAYWQSAIASRPSSVHKGYLLAGILWFIVPFSLSTSLGLTSIAIDIPIPIHLADSGLVAPAVAFHYLGASGGYIVIIIIVGSVFATTSAELLAVSSTYVYDIHRVYINPEVTGTEIIKWSRVAIVVFGLLFASFAVLLHELTLNMNWIYLSTGIFTGSAVIPISHVLLWKKATAIGAISGAVGGFILGITCWLFSTFFLGPGPEFSIPSVSFDKVMLIGNVVSITSSGIISTVIALMNPDYCEWDGTRNIELVEDDFHAIEDSDEELKHMYKTIKPIATFLIVVILVVVPCCTWLAKVDLLAFELWIVFALFWAIFAALFIVFLPMYESRDTIIRAHRNFKKLTIRSLNSQSDQLLLPSASDDSYYPSQHSLSFQNITSTNH